MQRFLSPLVRSSRFHLTAISSPHQSRGLSALPKVSTAIPPLPPLVQAATTAHADGLDRIPHLRDARGILRALDWAGTALFAASGTIAAASTGFDLLGSVAVGSVTALGGGTLRDIIIFNRPPFWSAAAADGGEPEYLWIAAIAALGAFYAYPIIGEAAWPNDDAPDAIALGAFAVIGAMNGARAGFPFAQSLLCGVATGCGGGTIRDVLLKRPVRIFHSHKELYATTVATGAAVFLAATKFGIRSFGIRVALGVGTTVMMRTASLVYGLRLPTWSVEAPPQQTESR